MNTLLAICREGFRRNRVPAFILQSCAALVLVAYFFVPASQPFFTRLAGWKAAYGYLFSAISTMIFGGLVSWGVLWYRGRIPKGMVLKQGLFFLTYWALQGIMVDTLYRFQETWFGQAHDPWTILKKVLVDQGPYNLFYATPASLLFYTWKDANFSIKTTRQKLRHQPGQRYWRIMISVWIVWIPSVTMIYMLPADLQIPLFNLVLCFFTLLLAFVSRDTTEIDLHTQDETGPR